MTTDQKQHQFDKKIFITIGDVGGVGPEVSLKALLSYPKQPDIQFHLIGPKLHWKYHHELMIKNNPENDDALNQIFEKCTMHDLETKLKKPELGKCDAEQGRIACEAIRLGVELVMDEQNATLVTAPINKESIQAAGSTYPGHTEMLRDLAGAEDTTMAFVGGGLVLALATIHVALNQVPNLITEEVLLRKARHLSRMLEYLGSEKQRIGVCGLNPHAGENDMFGTEESKIILPAIKRGIEKGLKLIGPVPGDTAFYSALKGEFDAVLAMYHDQGLAPLKTLAFDSAVNVTLGLPFIRTSPDHGTAFDIAGKGIANPLSMKQAILLAEKLCTKEKLNWA